MKYADLVQFEPIETVIELRKADASSEARNLVETFVISDRMAEQLTTMVFPHLRYDAPSDNKGLLVVGNYGTGKSHLMALISAIAEFPGLAASVAHAGVADAAAPVSGKFKVIRMETTSTTMGLRDLVCRNLEARLAHLGVAFAFPAAHEVTSNKDDFVALMAAFADVYPNDGLLLVLDELLDYLRTRKDQELILDLNFLRELGEVCRSTRFRFISGVQESLFDSGGFAHVADTLRRVKDRFEQVRIAREDVAFVVSRRILKKTTEQKARIREHLSKFSKLYSDMNERMDRYVELFPVHPAYLDAFEKVYVAEKREVLKTLSGTIKALLQQPVPSDQPGLVAYDGYWTQLRDNPSFRSIPEIKEVVDKSQVLEDRIKHGMSRPAYRPVALRIVHALSVHRLTTGDIYAPIGASAEELRDDLCLMVPGLPEEDAEFLRTLTEKVLAEITKTVSGQFLSHNPENGQFYLDLKKDIDFDSLIDKRAEGLGGDRLNRYYFEALAQVMEVTDQTYVIGYRIWEYAVEWREQKAERPGYLFFGAPNERSTAQPPRDFYVYFIQPFDPPYFKDEGKPDEVLVRLKHRDANFEKSLRLYAAAKEQAADASGSNKQTYLDKAAGHLRDLTKWLREHITTAFEVTWQSKPRSLAEVIQGKVAGGVSRAGVRDLVNTAASVCLAPHFLDRAPEYPIFTVLITRENLPQATQDALRWIGGGVKSRNGTAVLEALELLDGEVLKPRNSRYAKHVLDRLAEKKNGQVLTRGELVADEAGVEYWTRFRVEPEFLAVVLAALVQSGGVELSLPGKKLDASGLEQFARMAIAEVAAFKHVGQPKDLPLDALQELFEILGLPKGLIVNQNTREEAVVQLQQRTAQLLEHVVASQHRLTGGFPFWGRAILSDAEQTEWASRLANLKGFLESLQPFNTVGKLKNFPHDVAAVEAQRPGLATLKDVDDLGKLVQQVGPQTAWLTTAEAVLPESHPWRAEVNTARGDVLTKLTSPQHRQDSAFHRGLGQTLAQLRANFVACYRDLHKRQRLGASDDDKKRSLNTDPRMQQLRKLRGVEMMPGQELEKFENELLGLKTCFALEGGDLDASPICPHCQFRPVEEPGGSPAASARLAGLDQRLDDLVRDWTATLLGNLEDPTVADNIELLTDVAGKTAVKSFLAARALPEPVDNAFVKAVNDVLGGLEKVLVAPADLRKRLVDGGSPCTVDELEQRFQAFVSTLTRGKDRTKIRIVVE